MKLSNWSILLLPILMFFALSSNAQSGTVDPTFNSAGTGANNSVRVIVPLSDGKILIGGAFTSYNGITVNHIARLNADGTLDANFNTGGQGADDAVYSIAIQSDGKILIGGEFVHFNGSYTGPITRLNSDGSKDLNFNVTVGGSSTAGANGAVWSIAIQNGGKILIGGDFTTYNQILAIRITRLNANGALDTSFNLGGTGASDTVFSIVLQSNGKVLIGGFFTTYNNILVNRITRLNSDGTIDGTFNAGGQGTNNLIASILQQSDGNILIGGAFSNYNASPAMFITRFASNGTLDANFNSNNITGGNGINTMDLQTNGKILIGGLDLNINNATKSISRFNSDGNIDTNFNPSGTGPGGTFGGEVNTIALQSDGKIMVGGRFTTYNGTTVNYITRLLNLSSDATLSSLILSTGTLSPSFSSGTTAYSSSVANAVSSITVTPTATDVNCTIKVRVNGGTYVNVSTGATSSSLPLNVGANPIEVEVTAQDGTTINTYTITITRLPLPSIASFSPTSGPVGSLVTLTGSNLSSPTSFSIGSVSAITVSNDGSTLVGMVMPNALTGAIILTTSGGTATSSGSFTITAAPSPGAQQGNKLVGNDYEGTPWQGRAVAISADGNTAIVGGYGDFSNHIGAAWVYTRSNGVWSQQGSKLVGSGYSGVGGNKYQGWSVAISADGNTVIVGGYGDNNYIGAAWVFVRSNGGWDQQGSKLVGSSYIGSSQQGTSVSLSADGNTALIGGSGDNSGIGATWVFTRNGSTWAQQGAKLVGSGFIGTPVQGASVSLSSDGKTALIGGYQDNNSIGAAWIFTRNGTSWNQQSKLVGNGGLDPFQGYSVSLSADGNIAAVGGTGDNNNVGAVWVFTRSGGTWNQQGSKLVGSNYQGSSVQGYSVSLNSDGSKLIFGGRNDNNIGAAWVFSRSGANWLQQGNKLAVTGYVGGPGIGASVSMSADGSTAIVGGDNDNNGVGAAWIFTPSNSASLGNLSLSVGILTPTFSSTTYTYSSCVSGSTSSITVIPTNADATSTVTVNGVLVPSGNASSPISLSPGNNIITVIVTAQDGTTTNTYTVNVSRPIQPTISAGGPTTLCSAGSVSLTSSSANGNQWYKDANAISLATAQSYIATTAGDYTVVVSNSGCSSNPSASVHVSIIPPPSSTISYSGSPYCSNGGTVSVTQTGTSGGIYSSTAGLNIDASTGAINLGASTGGTYTVTYSIPASGGCSSFSTTATVTIISPASLSISYAGNPFCQTGVDLVTRTGLAGGTYSSDANMFVNPNSGTIIPAASTPGVHTITYSVNFPAGCTSSATTTVTILPTPTITIGTASPVCFFANVQATTLQYTATTNAPTAYSIRTSANSPMPGFVPVVNAALSANSIPVNIPAGTPGGTYYFELHVSTANGCTSGKYVFGVTVMSQTSTTIAYNGGQSICQVSNSLVTRTGASGGTYSSTPSGLVLDQATGTIFPAPSNAATYTITYTVAGAGCTFTNTTNVTVVPTPRISLGTASAVCQSANAATASVPYTVTAGTPATYSLTAAATASMPGFVAVSDAALSPNQISIAIPAGTAIGTYYFDLYMKTAQGCLSGKYVVRVKVTGCPVTTPAYVTSGRQVTSTSPRKDNTFSNSVTIAPNPVQSRLSIHTSGEGSMLLTITTSEGKMLMNKARFISYYSFDMSSYAAGVYMVEVVNERTGEMVRKKVVKE